MVKDNSQTVDSNIGKLFELGVLEAALAAMSAHAAERAVQAAACGMLACLGSASPHATAIRAKFAELGAVARIMGALDAFPSDRKLVAAAVDVLGSLMNGNTAGTAQIIALGGIERVLMAMDNHPDFRVCYHAVFFLYITSLLSPEATQRLAALGAAARVRGAMAAPDAHALTTEYGQKLLDRLLAVDFATYIFTQCVSIYIYICVYVYACVCIYMYVYMHIYIHGEQEGEGSEHRSGRWSKGLPVAACACACWCTATTESDDHKSFRRWGPEAALRANTLRRAETRGATGAAS